MKPSERIHEIAKAARGRMHDYAIEYEVEIIDVLAYLDEREQEQASRDAKGGCPACPSCEAPEVEANTPRTTYACGSSDYDQRPGTFVHKCKEQRGRTAGDLVWLSSLCGHSEPAQPEYSDGDEEACVHCDSPVHAPCVARVVRLPPASALRSKDQHGGKAGEDSLIEDLPRDECREVGAALRIIRKRAGLTMFDMASRYDGESMNEIHLLIGKTTGVIGAYYNKANVEAKRDRYNADPFLEPGQPDPDAPYVVVSVGVADWDET